MDLRLHPGRPRRARRAGDPRRDRPEGTRGRGSTVRVYDTALGAWRVSWFGAEKGDFCTLVATPYRRDGIRQDGTQTDGRPIRWNFSNITDESFEWDGWVSDD